MEKKTANCFVDKMRRDAGFRSAVRQTQSECELNSILKGHGYEFKFNELAQAMATCMDQLDSMETK
jgi:predicted ribosomally synthesized peptide with nif11-like leader